MSPERPNTRRPELRLYQLARGIGLLLLLAAAMQSTSEVSGQDLEPLERYLVRLGLSDLQARLLEGRLAAEPSEAGRERVARRLADVYAGQLVEAADDPEEFARIMERINALVQQVPQAQTPLLQVMLLQAEYYRAEAQTNDWLTDQSDEESRLSALEILSRIAPVLDKHQADLSRDVEKRIKEMDELEVGEQLESAERVLAPIRAVAGRAMYFAATASYYRDLLAQSTEVEGYKVARRLYRKLLGIEGQYSDYNAGILGLLSIWRARSLVGLALAEAALGNQEASNQCFAWLTDNSVAAVIRNQIPYWRLRAFASTGQFADLLSFARQHVDSFSSSPAADTVSFCVGLVRTGFGAATGSPQLREIGMLGLAGLVKLRQDRAASKLLEEYQVEIAEDSGFYLKWIKAQRRFEQAEASKSAADYEAAAFAFEQALDAPDARRDLNAAARCQTQLAWCNYRLNRLEQAARLFEQASTGLKATNDLGAAKSAWNAFLSYQRLVKSESRFSSSAIDVLDRIQREFPNSSYAKEAGYYVGKLRQNSRTPEESLRQLAKIAPDSDNYLAARYDICKIWAELSRERTGQPRSEAVEALVSSVDTYLRAAGRRDDSDRKINVCLLVVQAAEQGEPFDLGLARRYLSRARPFVDELPAGDRRAAEFHYRAMQVAAKAGEIEERNREAAWIAANARGSPYELNALISVVKLSEAELEKLPPEQRRAQTEIVYSHWRRLTELLGTTATDIATNKNSRVANSKLAKYAASLGKHAQAAVALRELLKSDPKNRSYLRRAGQVEFQLGNHEESLGHWQTLLRGLKRGSDEWYEAKYFQLSCLRRLDDVRFRRAADQFRLLYPELGPAAWRPRFAEMLPK